MPNGDWFWNDKTQNSWSNYSQCYVHTSHVLINVTDQVNNNINVIKVNEKNRAILPLPLFIESIRATDPTLSFGERGDEKID